MFVCTALSRQQHTPTSSAHSSEQSVTKHQIIILYKILLAQSLEFWLFSKDIAISKPECHLKEIHAKETVVPAYLRV